MTFDDLDADTRLLFGEISCCLALFGYAEVAARSLIDRYLENNYSQDEEDLLHHEGAYRAAGIIHFTVGLNCPRSELKQYLSKGLPVSAGEAVSLLADFRWRNQLPQILGGDGK